MIEKLICKKYISLILVLILVIVSVLPIVSGSIVNNQPRIEHLNRSRGNDWWSMYRHEPTHVGSSTSSTPDSEEFLWSYQTDDFISSSPAVSHGKVYIGSWDQKIYCFGMDNGDVLWEYATNGQITSSPAVANGNVYIGSQDSKFYCLDAFDGSYIWDYETGYMIETSPTVKDGKVFFGSSDGSMYCLNADDGSLVWNYPSGNVILSSPAVTDDNVYFGSLNGDLLCLDIIDGDLVWDYATTSGIWSSPTVYDGNVYFGSNNNYVYCLNADDGGFIWSFDTGGEVHSSPAIAYGNVYIGSSPRGLFCLEAETGDLVWKYLISDGIWSPPSVADDKVYYGTDPCCGAPAYFHCSDAYTGDRIWKYNTGGEIVMKSSPAIAAGKVFIGTGNGKVMAFGEIQYIADANGPYYGFSKTPVHFNGSVYGGVPDYSWYWEFGDGDTSTDQNPTHTFNASGEYDVTLTVTDDEGSVSTDETKAFIEMIINDPPAPPFITGPKNGKAGVEYEWTFVSTDPDGDDVYYRVEWGDACGSHDWVGPYPSGQEITVNHTYGMEGSFVIYAKAVDIYDGESDWSTFEISMPRNKILHNSFLIHLLEWLPNAFPILQYIFKAIL